MQIEFIEDGHIYIVDGVITPSVTQIVRKILGGHQYDGVPENILHAKAVYGEEMHEWVERFMQEGNYDTAGLNQTQRMSVPYVTDILEKLWRPDMAVICEKPVTYKGIFAGKFDALLYDKKSKRSCLIDIKTTAKYDHEYLTWQLSLYSMAIEDTMKIKPDSLKCLWVPKRELPRLIDVTPKTKEECLSILLDIGVIDRE